MRRMCKLVRVKKSQNISHFVMWLWVERWSLFTDVGLFFTLIPSHSLHPLQQSSTTTNKMNCLRWLDEYFQWICQTYNEKHMDRTWIWPCLRHRLCNLQCIPSFFSSKKTFLFFIMFDWRQLKIHSLSDAPLAEEIFAKTYINQRRRERDRYTIKWKGTLKEILRSVII